MKIVLEDIIGATQVYVAEVVKKKRKGRINIAERVTKSRKGRLKYEKEKLHEYPAPKGPKREEILFYRTKLEPNTKPLSLIKKLNRMQSICKNLGPESRQIKCRPHTVHFCALPCVLIIVGDLRQWSFHSRVILDQSCPKAPVCVHKRSKRLWAEFYLFS